MCVIWEQVTVHPILYTPVEDVPSFKELKVRLTKGALSSSNNWRKLWRKSRLSEEKVCPRKNCLTICGFLTPSLGLVSSTGRHLARMALGLEPARLPRHLRRCCGRGRFYTDAEGWRSWLDGNPGQVQRVLTPIHCWHKHFLWKKRRHPVLLLHSWWSLVSARRSLCAGLVPVPSDSSCR